MNKVKVKTPAKLNLALDITGVRADGYHEIATVMQTVSIYDEITITKSPKEGITLSTSLHFLPIDGKNLAAKAAKAFFEYAGFSENIEIDIKKKIPVGAGMAGGSANAAGVLLGLNELFETAYTMEQLDEMAKDLGADVAFCLRRGTYLATGIGNTLVKTTNMPPCTFVIAKPRRSISTPMLYEKYDENPLAEGAAHPDIRGLIASLSVDIKHAAPHMANVLEGAAIEIVPQIAEMKDDMLKHGALTAIMTGSGSAVFGVFAKNKQATDCSAIMREKYQGCFVTPANPVFS